MTSTLQQRSPWLLNSVPDDAEFLLFGFPYAGVGASSYRDWPRRIGPAAFCALQPPGRENRIRENDPGSHQEFAELLIEGLSGHLERPYAFLGHCGAFPYMLQTTLQLRSAGLPLPRRIFASSWGAPHRGLYGRLNFVDLDRVDMVAEIQDICARLGRPLLPELAELAAETMLVDLRVQRDYRYDGTPRVPVPVTLLGWTRDDVVPPGTITAGWEECADVTQHLLDGDHGAFLRCPQALRELITADLTAPDRAHDKEKSP